MEMNAKTFAAAILAAPLVLGPGLALAAEGGSGGGSAAGSQAGNKGGQTAAAGDAATRGQQTGAAQAGEDRGILAISEWRYDEIYAAGGMRAEDLLDAEVYGVTGEEIGDIENVILDENDKIVAVIAEVGGFWDIGDTHVAVPWEEVTLTGDGVQVPVSEENIEAYGLYAESSIVTKNLEQTQRVDDETWTGPRTWKLTSLVDNYAVTETKQPYGYIVDAIFSQEGDLQAVMVEPSTGYGVGPVAYPFYGYGYDYGWRAGAPYYQLPYDEQEVVQVEPFDYDRYETIWD